MNFKSGYLKNCRNYNFYSDTIKEILHVCNQIRKRIMIMIRSWKRRIPSKEVDKEEDRELEKEDRWLEKEDHDSRGI